VSASRTRDRTFLAYIPQEIEDVGPLREDIAEEKQDTEINDVKAPQNRSAAFGGRVSCFNTESRHQKQKTNSGSDDKEIEEHARMIMSGFCHTSNTLDF
jgi:hypothetical protein